MLLQWQDSYPCYQDHQPSALTNCQDKAEILLPWFKQQQNNQNHLTCRTLFGGAGCDRLATSNQQPTSTNLLLLYKHRLQSFTPHTYHSTYTWPTQDRSKFTPSQYTHQYTVLIDWFPVRNVITVLMIVFVMNPSHIFAYKCNCSHVLDVFSAHSIRLSLCQSSLAFTAYC